MRECPWVLMVMIVFCIVAAPAFAGDVSVYDGWFRALPSGQPAGGYFKLKNIGTAPVALLAAKSPVCGMLMLHRSVSSGGTSRMADVEKVSIPPGGVLSFAPGGYHLMCMSPSAAMAPGKSVPVTLVFSDGSTSQSEFVVKNAAGK